MALNGEIMNEDKAQDQVWGQKGRANKYEEKGFTKMAQLISKVAESIERNRAIRAMSVLVSSKQQEDVRQVRLHDSSLVPSFPFWENRHHHVSPPRPDLPNRFLLCSLGR